MLRLHIFRRVEEYIDELSEIEKVKIRSAIRLLVEHEQVFLLKIKTLRWPIQELIVKQYRLVFFKENETIYVIDIFRKKSRKTPLYIIEHAEQILQIIQSERWD